MLLFYLAPIAVATWFLGTGFGVAMCALSVVAADVADIAAGVPAITIWNSLTSFCAYLIITILFRRVHLLLIEMDSRVKERTSALQQELARRQELEIEIARIGEEERGRVGRELHDSLGQHLTGTALLAQTVANQLEQTETNVQPTARRVVKLINEGIELTREIARGLYSSELDGDGLFSALDSFAMSISNETTRCRFTHEGTPPQSKELATHLYWIAREAATNAVKHGRPEHVDIHLNTKQNRFELVVRDDGESSFDGRPKDGIGLKVMAQRAQLAGGALRIENLGDGIVVQCSGPVSGEDDHGE